MIGFFRHGKMIHNYIIEAGMELDAVIQTSLIYMYGQLGSLEEATKVLDSSSCSCVESWTAMIAGYAKQGNYGKVQQCMDDMHLSGSKPDEKTYTSILVGCSHSAEVSEGGWHLQSMLKTHGIMPEIEHFTCMIDILGRAGRLDEAEKILKSMPSTMTIGGWMSLLMACKQFGNNRLGKLCFSRLVELDPKGATGYMLMLGIHADESVNKWTEVNDSVNKCVIGDKKGLFNP